jgi:hypothetical protein
VAPMKVNSNKVITNLNADKLDGKDASEFAKAYKRTVVVSPVGNDTQQNGQALLDALSGITDASATKEYLLYTEAGTYDLGNGSLQMKQHVDIQGAGELKTIITSSVSASWGTGTGTLVGADNAELRFLTVRNTGTGDFNTAIANDSASPRLTHVTAEAAGMGALQNNGVFNLNSSSPTMTDITATASGGADGFNVGVLNSNSSPIIRQSKLSGTDYSLYHFGGGTAKVALTQLVGFVPKVSGSTLQCFTNYDANMAAVSC